MTTVNDIQYTLSHISVEAYMAELDDAKPLTFIPGNKTMGVYPKIVKADGSTPDYIPQLNLGDSNNMVLTKLNAATAVFYAIRKARQAKAEALKTSHTFVNSTGTWVKNT